MLDFSKVINECLLNMFIRKHKDFNEIFICKVLMFPANLITIRGHLSKGAFCTNYKDLPLSGE